MFGFQGGETPDTVSRKRGYLLDAQQRWGSLTYLDLSTIKSEAQLITLVKERLGLPMAQIKSDVESWTQGKQF